MAAAPPPPYASICSIPHDYKYYDASKEKYITMHLLARSAIYDALLVQATAITIVNYNCNVVIEKTAVDQNYLLKMVICKEIVKISES